MSDSDDTDVLLLIPPSFFLVDEYCDERFDHRTALSVHEQFECNPETSPHLFMSNRSELDSINARLAQIERDYQIGSDISTISRCTVKSRDDYVHRREVPFKSTSPSQFVHSTPKCDDNFEVAMGANNNADLQHMYLNKKPLQIETYSNKNPKENGHPAFGQDYRNSLGSARLSDWNRQQPGDREPLLSLNDIWGKEDYEERTSIAEETLRRKHCERTIQALQTKLLEYQQKIAVAIEVDKKKDIAIHKHAEENFNLKSRLQKLSSDIQSIEGRQLENIKTLELENASLKSQKELLEADLTAIKDLVSGFEEKNQLLEVKIAQLMRASSETTDVYKKQIADLEVRVSNSHHNRGQLEEQIANLKGELTKVQTAASKESKEIDLLNKKLELCQDEVKLLQQQKRDTLEKYRHEKSRAETLSNEKKTIEENLNELKRKETNVLRELESQRISLKSYYQQQLEEVIAKKLSEFQTQLDSAEERLRSEAKEREKLLAERAIKQIEMINAKNEQEISLLQEKHNEEVELYRIQLSNATRTIDELQEKLEGYRSRRADIASKLHSIMESQWQKALEVLTSPNGQGMANGLSLENINHGKVDGVALDSSSKHENPENECFETPTSSRNRKMRDKRTEEKLQAYIQLLLNKSPRDLDNLEEFLQMPKHADTSQQKHDISQKNESTIHKSRRDQKPPWK